MEKPDKIIKDLNVSTNATDLNSLGTDVTALKLAFGLLFQKLDDQDRVGIINTLKQTNTPALTDLANQLEQFRI